MIWWLGRRSQRMSSRPDDVFSDEWRPEFRRNPKCSPSKNGAPAVSCEAPESAHCAEDDGLPTEGKPILCRRGPFDGQMPRDVVYFGRGAWLSDSMLSSRAMLETKTRGYVQESHRSLVHHANVWKSLAKRRCAPTTPARRAGPTWPLPIHGGEAQACVAIRP